MIKTSYFAKIKQLNIPVDDCVAITLGAAFWKGEKETNLAPTKELLNWWKSLSKEEQLSKEFQSKYKKEYVKTVLNKLNPKEIYKKYNNKIFLCFEKTGDFCHRHIVSSWLKYHGFECEEL